MSGPNWYDVLGVDEDADRDEIRLAWQASIAGLDPTDRRFRLYNKAAEVLLDDNRRAAYDDELSAAAPAEEPEPRTSSTTTTSTIAPAADEAPSTHTSVTSALSRHVPTAVIAALALAVLVAAGAAYWLHRTTVSPEETEAAIADARTAAEAAVPKVFTYDYRYPERDHDRAMRVLTGDLKDEYDRLWNDAIEPNLLSSKGAASSEVLGTGVVRASDGDRVEVLVVLRSTAGTEKLTVPVTVPLTATMVEKDGTWLIEKLDGWDPESTSGEQPAPSEPAPTDSAPPGSGKKSGQEPGQKSDQKPGKKADKQ